MVFEHRRGLFTLSVENKLANKFFFSINSHVGILLARFVSFFNKLVQASISTAGRPVIRLKSSITSVTLLSLRYPGQRAHCAPYQDHVRFFNTA